MIVYRISSLKYASKLQASGIEARWNLANQNVLYTSQSRALACLENIVHRSMTQLSGLFKVLVIEIPEQSKIEIIDERNLPPDWRTQEKRFNCRELGSSWYISGKSSVLRVPSALIPQEFNFVIHTNHPAYEQIRLLDTEEFYFDQRVKV